MDRMTIKDWAWDDRPREKFLEQGAAGLSNAELIAILLGSGSRDESAVDLAKAILARADNDLECLGRMSLADFCQHKGVGNAKSITLMAALELGRRRSAHKPADKMVVSSSRSVFELLQPMLADLAHEEFWVLLLNRSHVIIDKFRVSQGGISGTVVDTRMILKRAIEKLASSMILVHNHPSGNKKPSTQDISITKKIKDAGQIMDVRLLDHLIISGNDFFSMADESLI